MNFLTIKDLMQITKESESASWKRLKRREIEFVKLSGGTVRVSSIALQNWLEARTVKREAK